MRNWIAALLGIVILSSGCLDIDVHQKIQRNGLYDLNLTISSDAETVTSLFSKEIESNVSDSKFRYEEGDGYVRFIFTDINSTEHPIGGSDIGSLRVEKEFKFPYQYYTYEIGGLSGEDAAPKNDSAGLLDFEYTIESFGTLTETNGRKIDRQTVTFDIGFANWADRHYAVYRDFVILSWFNAF